MNNRWKSLATSAPLVLAALSAIAPVQAEASVAPGTDSVALHQRMLHRRAVETVIWGMPAVNFQLMYEAMARETRGTYNQIVYWSRLPDWKNQTLTPNPDVIYLMPFFNTQDVGPVVLEIPPADEGAINGSVMDLWQAAIEDVGPAGVDKGKGGKYLILPPGYDKQKVPEGYIPLPSYTYRGYALLRSVLRGGSDAEIAQAVAYARRIRMYPLSQAANPPQTNFIDAVDVVFDAAIPYDMRFFLALDKIIQEEPWLERDKALIDTLRTVGIVRGKPFNPDASQRKTLDAAVKEARLWLDDQYESILTPYYGKGNRWSLPGAAALMKSVESAFTLPDLYPVDARGVTYTFAFFSPRHPGKGQFYLMTVRDKDGRPLDGKSTYRLNVPANAPVTQYWSATAYNRETHTLIRDVKWAGRSSQTPGLQKNVDGSADIYFGPQAPAGKASNWVPTDPKRRFEVLFRFYGPQKPLFDKTWVLGDIERVK